MNNLELAAKCKEIATNYNTIYIMGCFGAPITSSTVDRYVNNLEYNKGRESMIRAVVDKGYFGFDCVCLIKAILWGWSGSRNDVYGGAKYASNGVPDISTEGMIGVCSDVTTDFSNIEVGELLWNQGHVGVYIGDGLCVECTPAWKNNVQITAVANIGIKNGYHSRRWTKHGKLPYVEYVEEHTPTTHKIDAVNSTRKTDYLCIYDSAGLSTGTNVWGAEAIVNCYGKVTNKPKYGNGNNKVPKGGFVLSGHGAAADWLLANVKKGYRVYRENGSVRIGRLTDGKIGYIAGTDTVRLDDEIIIYNKLEYTGTNIWGTETLVSNGVVLYDPVMFKNNYYVSVGCFAISGHGAGAKWIKANLKKGSKIRISGDVIEVVE